MIEDEELRQLFEVESQEHLQKLDDGFLQLEQHANNPAVLQELFREAHSLKGASRMLGVDTVETLSHHLEDILGVACRKGEMAFSSELVDRLTQGLDDIRAMVREAVSGEPAGISVIDALARMTGQQSGLQAVAEKQPVPVVVHSSVPRISEDLSRPPFMEQEQVVENTFINESATTVISLADVEQSEEQEVEPLKVAPVVGEVASAAVIRVDAAKLDLLLNLVGELSVIRTRVKRRLTEVDATITQWELSAKEEGVGHFMLGGDGHGGKQSGLVELGLQLHELRSGIFADEVALDGVARGLEEGIHNLRLLPLLSLFSLFPRLVRDLARQQSKQVTLKIEGGETTADKRIIEEMKNPLMHLVRNAMDHGMESPQERLLVGKPAEGTLIIKASRSATHVIIEVIDDGRGLNLETIKQVARKRHLITEQEEPLLTDAQIGALIFKSGFSTSSMVTDLSGRGVGLDVVRVNIERLKGSVRVDSQFGSGCCFSMRLPITLTTTPVFIVTVGAHHYAIPLDCVHTVRHVHPEEIFSIEGRDAFALQGLPVSIVYLADLLEMEAYSVDRPPSPWACIVLMVGEEQVGIIVDSLDDELEVVMKPHGGFLQRVRNIAGTTILGTGEVCMVLNPEDLIKSVQKIGRLAVMKDPLNGRNQGETHVKKSILLAEDSITTRIQEKRILEGAGYQVVVAVDGADAFNKLGQHPFDALISDVQMPNLDGLALTAKIRQNPAYRDLPVILVTSLASDEDLRRGLEVGANAYITKPTFDQNTFLETVRRLI